MCPFTLRDFILVIDNVHDVDSMLYNVAVNKQLNDKERVAAALENPNLVDMVDECLAPTNGLAG